MTIEAYEGELVGFTLTDANGNNIDERAISAKTFAKLIAKADRLAAKI